WTRRRWKPSSNCWPTPASTGPSRTGRCACWWRRRARTSAAWAPCPSSPEPGKRRTTKSPSRGRASCTARVSELGDVFRLQALLALGDGELDALPLDQRTVAFATDRTIVHEHVRAALALNESIALGIVEPLDGSNLTI